MRRTGKKLKTVERIGICLPALNSKGLTNDYETKANEALAGCHVEFGSDGVASPPRQDRALSVGGLVHTRDRNWHLLLRRLSPKPLHRHRSPLRRCKKRRQTSQMSTSPYRFNMTLSTSATMSHLQATS
ncbi:hypothetical protein EVAR_96508_1 [Eumeta japonica]|uniref:Uncharacterized protein n=1 Tax=Eumeta variegata TaxID=151549 RepID=A0A4C1WDM8_EUMVA|nr:hypothetical protein EVAR_96508_1 [Eumeta japonica]